MCGSGTFCLEAHEMATGRLPNTGRKFAFLGWPAFRPAAYRHLEKKLLEAARPSAPPKRLFAFDIDPAAVEAAKRNLSGAGEAEVSRRDFLGPEGAPSALGIPEDARCLVVLNPPYGKRLDAGDLRKTYRRIGERIRNHYRGGYAIIVPGLEYEKVLSLPHDRKLLFRNGGIKVSAIIRNPRGPGAS
jgi:putative N6-adenine-specific DNA methylase